MRQVVRGWAGRRGLYCVSRGLSAPAPTLCVVRRRSRDRGAGRRGLVYSRPLSSDLMCVCVCVCVCVFVCVCACMCVCVYVCDPDLPPRPLYMIPTCPLSQLTVTHTHTHIFYPHTSPTAPTSFTFPLHPHSPTYFSHTLHQQHPHILPSHFTHTHPHTLPTYFTHPLHPPTSTTTPTYCTLTLHPHTLPTHFNNTHILYPHTSPTAPT